MFMLIKTAFAILLVVAACVTSYGQQDESKRPSPAAQTQCKFSGGKTITVNYSSPRMKGRSVFGELVPYGKIWRTGANERQLQDAALADGILRTAQQNAASTINSLLQGLGFEKIGFD
jgi:hypothetical protein